MKIVLMKAAACQFTKSICRGAGTIKTEIRRIESDFFRRVVEQKSEWNLHSSFSSIHPHSTLNLATNSECLVFH